MQLSLFYKLESLLCTQFLNWRVCVPSGLSTPAVGLGLGPDWKELKEGKGFCAPCLAPFPPLEQKERWTTQ